MEKLYRHPWIIVLVITLITVFFALQLPRLELDNNNFRFVSENDPARLTSQYIDDTFGSSVFILVALHRKTGDVFDPAFLSTIRDYVERVEEISICDSVTSIVNADYITGDSEYIIVEKLLPDDFTGTPEEIAQLKERLLSWEMYRRALISDDFSSTQILVPLSIDSEDAGRPEIVDSFIQVRDIALEMFDGIAEIHVTGIPIISATINEAMRTDLSLLIPLVTVVVLAILFFSFRRLSGVVLPLLTVVIATIWSMGAMPLFNINLSVISTVLPVILVAVGSAYGIHVITHYMAERKNAEINRAEHRELVIGVMNKVMKPVFLAAITTVVGFFSLSFSGVLPIREFGFFSGFGVIASFAVAITLIPALLIIRGPSGNPGKAETASGVNNGGAENNSTVNNSRFSAVVSRVFSAAALRKKTVLSIAVLVVIIAAIGASRIIIDNVFIEYFKPDTDIAKSDRFIREQFGGSKIISIVAEAETSEILLSPACLLAMDNLNRHLETNVPEVGKTMGFTTLIKRINQIFNADKNPEDYYEIPADPAKYGKTQAEELTGLVSNYLILLSGDIDEYANSPLEPTAIKTTVQLRTLGESDTNRAVEAIQTFVEANFPKEVKVTIGGSALVESSVNRQVVNSQITSLFVSLVLVFLIIALSNRSVTAGLIGIAPLSISILINFAVMGYLGIKLNLGTSMIASLAVGIGIDYTIHYLESFKRELHNPVFADAQELRAFLMRTFSVSGKAIIINALSVGAGFAVLLFSRFNMLGDFGLLVALTMAVNGLLSLTLIPALLLTFRPSFVFSVKEN